MNTTTRIARWESRSGIHWVELHRDQHGFTYTSPTASGSLGDVAESDAIATIAARCAVGAGYFQPDAAKTAMRRVDTPPGRRPR